jgi:hypothetical protein
VATDATPAALAGLDAGALAAASADTTVLLAGGGANVWLAPPEAAVEADADGRGHVLAVAAEARAALASTPLRVELDVQNAGARAVSETFRGSGRATFRQPVPGPGPWACRVLARADDRLPDDNLRFVTATAAVPARVLVADAAGEAEARVRTADLVEAAFAGETPAAKRVERRPASAVTRADAASAGVVVWVGSAAHGAGALAGTAVPVVWVPADPEPPAAPLAEALGLDLGAARAVDAGVTVDPGGYTSDLLAAFEGGTSGDLAAAVFRRRLTAVEPGAEASGGGAFAAAARFRDGAPALLDGRGPGGRRVVALLAGPAPVWGDLASRPEWVVLAHSLVEALAPGGAAAVRNLTVAEAAEAGLTPVAEAPGNYTGTDAAGRTVHWSVNLDPAETADLRPDPARLKAAFGKAPYRLVRPGTDPLTAIAGLGGGSGRDLTPLAAAALAAVLLAEGLLAWRLAGRRQGGPRA